MYVKNSQFSSDASPVSCYGCGVYIRDLRSLSWFKAFEMIWREIYKCLLKLRRMASTVTEFFTKY
jgi:hypothetical protein